MKIILVLISALFLTSCGYNIVKHADTSHFNLIEISSSGVQKINYKINNSLTFRSSKDSYNLLKIKLHSEKKKTIKEKNIKNEITKYQITINVKVDYSVVNKNHKKTFYISHSGDLNVASSTVQTLNNEKKIIETVTKKIIDDIINTLNLEINDI